MTLLAAPVLALLLQEMIPAPSPSPSPSPPPPDAKTIVERAIKARGGEDVLKRATVLDWRARGLVHSGERAVSIVGRWIVEPPDRAVIVTSETGKGAPSRRVTLLGTEAFVDAAGTRTPLTAEMLAAERDRLYLYSLLRVLPLRDPEMRLTATGPRTLRVEREGRPTVDMFFDGTGWLDRLRAERRDPATGAEVVEEITFAGELAVRGLRWPRRINVTRDGAPVYDLDIDELRVGTAADLTREAERK